MEQMYLFGCYARGDAEESSGIDFAVQVAGNLEKRYFDFQDVL